MWDPQLRPLRPGASLQVRLHTCQWRSSPVAPCCLKKADIVLARFVALSRQGLNPPAKTLPFHGDMTKGDAFVNLLIISNPIFAVFQFVNWRCHVTYICDFEFTASGLDFLGLDFLGPYKAAWSTSLFPFSFNLITSVFGCLTSHGRTVGSFRGGLEQERAISPYRLKATT